MYELLLRAALPSPQHGPAALAPALLSALESRLNAKARAVLEFFFKSCRKSESARLVHSLLSLLYLLEVEFLWSLCLSDIPCRILQDQDQEVKEAALSCAAAAASLAPPAMLPAAQAAAIVATILDRQAAAASRSERRPPGKLETGKK